MKKVVESSIKTVGGFIVPLVCDSNELKYMSIFISNRKLKEQENFFEIKNNQIQYDFGTVEDGAYVKNILYTSQNIVAIHFPLAKIGLIYTKSEDGFMYPKKFSLDEIDFFDMLDEKFNIDRRFSVLINHGAPCLSSKGYEKINTRDFEKAVSYFIKAIQKMYEGIIEYKENEEELLAIAMSENNFMQRQFLIEGLKINLYWMGIAYHQLKNNKKILTMIIYYILKNCLILLIK